VIDQVKMNSEDCEYFPKLNGFVRVWNHKFPQKIYLKSQWTGKTLEFNPLTYDDPKFDQDGWDGEQMIYRAVSSDPKKRELTLSLYHGQ